MNISIALLSGKGGSGKTSLALTLGSLLSACEIDTVLFDCDLATNGAAYFFETKLSRNVLNITSVTDWISETYCPDGRDQFDFIELNPYFKVLPSITAIPSDTPSLTKFTEAHGDDFRATMKQIQENHEVVLYDFQAGYTDLMKLFLPNIDVCLFVVEPDAVSSSSLRSLYLKIGTIIENKKNYQVFNKASEEEYKIYSKLYTGTLFTNIETIRFDWEIRKAFSLNQVPSIGNCSYHFLEQIVSIAKQIIQDDSIGSRLKKYESELEWKKLEQSENRIKQRLFMLEHEIDTDIDNDSVPHYVYRKNDRKRTFIFFYSLFSLAILFVFIIMMWLHGDAFSVNEITTIAILSGILMVSCFFIITKDLRYPSVREKAEREILEYELTTLHERKKELTKDLAKKEATEE